MGTPKGAEITVHALRRYIKGNHDADKVVLKLDFRNAFNSMRRDKILAKVGEHIHCLYPMIWKSYISMSNLYFGYEYIIESEEGIQ